jgi:hypothetical protein
MADFNQYPMIDEFGNFPEIVQKAMAASPEVAKVINDLIVKAGGVSGGGGTGTGSGSTVVVGGITTVY